MSSASGYSNVARRPERYWLEVAYFPSTSEYYCDSVDWPGITACSHNRQDVLLDFKEAIRVHREENPNYVLPAKPSSKSKAKDHQKAAIEESIQLGSEEQIVASLELLEY